MSLGPYMKDIAVSDLLYRARHVPHTSQSTSIQYRNVEPRPHMPPHSIGVFAPARMLCGVSIFTAFGCALSADHAGPELDLNVLPDLVCCRHGKQVASHHAANACLHSCPHEGKLAHNLS